MHDTITLSLIEYLSVLGVAFAAGCFFAVGVTLVLSGLHRHR